MVQITGQKGKLETILTDRNKTHENLRDVTKAVPKGNLF